MSIQQDMRYFASGAALIANYKTIRARLNQPTRFGPEPGPVAKTGKEVPSKPEEPPMESKHQPAPPPSAEEIERARRTLEAAAAAEKLAAMQKASAGPLTVSIVIRAAALHFDLGREIFTSAIRSGPAVYYRHIVMYLARQMGWSTPEIGRRLGGRDHTTILHGASKIAREIAQGNEKTIADVAGVRERLIQLRPELASRIPAGEESC